MERMDFTRLTFCVVLISGLFHAIDLATVSKIETLTRARCHATCITHFSSTSPQYNSTSPCGEDKCQQCISWCTPSPNRCKTACNNSICAVACDFLTNLPSDVEIGSGFSISNSGVPYVVKKNFTSLTLRWEPAKNLHNGTVVYSLEMQYGKQLPSVDTWVNLNLITHVPYITLTQNDLCYRTEHDFVRGGPAFFFFKYRIISLTEKSKTSSSRYSNAIGLPRPLQVENVTVIVGPFEKDRSDKLRVSLKWMFKQRTKDFIKYYITVKCSVNGKEGTSATCGRRSTAFHPRRYSSEETAKTIYLAHKSLEKGNILRFQIVAMIGCGATNVTEVNITYPGCFNIERFPTQTCCETEPPRLPDSDRGIRKLTFEPLQPEPDYRFKTNITWIPPAYMEKTNCSLLYAYFINYGDPNKFRIILGRRFWGTRIARYRKTYVGPVLLEPGTKFAIEITTVFRGVKAVFQNMSFYAPGVPLDKVKIQNISIGDPMLTSNGSFNITALWKKPSFNYSFIEFYLFVYFHQDGRNVSVKVNSNYTSYTISGGIHGETLSFEILPWYIHQWIPKLKSKRWSRKLPEPEESELKVRDLEFIFTNETKRTYNVTFTWKQPSFKYSKLLHYNVLVIFGAAPYSYNLTRQWLTVTRAKPDEEISILVTTVFDNPYLKSVQSSLTVTTPGNEGDVIESDKPKPQQLSTIIIVIICLALFMVLLLAILLLIVVPKWTKKRKLKNEGLLIGKNGFVVDEWEVDPTNIIFEHEIGEGAFGKVFSGIMEKLPEPAAKAAFFSGLAARKTMKTNDEITVAVKILHSHIEQSDERSDFLQEIQLMKSVGFHSNIVNMLGCSTLKYPMCLIVEYVPYGDLLHYLRKRRGDVKEYLTDEHSGPYRSFYFDNFRLLESYGNLDEKSSREDRHYVNRPGSIGRRESNSSDNVKILSFRETDQENEKTEGSEDMELKSLGENENDLSPGDLLAFAWQVSRGMEYLARKGFIHRDIAARNILIGHNKVAKIADFGLTRCVYDEGGIYPMKTKRKLPLKWMSIEAIFDGVFTTQSDVWSFGILLWEIGTLGGTPYPTINNHELLKFLKSGKRLEKPEVCNDEYYAIMAKCWKENPDERPSFTQLREDLENMMIIDKPYLDFDGFDESREYYNVPSFHSIQDDDEEFILGEEDKESDRSPNHQGDLGTDTLSEDSKGKWNEEKAGATDKKQISQDNNLEELTTDSKVPCNRQDSEGSNRPLIIKSLNLDIDDMQSRMCRPLAPTTSLG